MDNAKKEELIKELEADGLTYGHDFTDETLEELVNGGEDDEQQ